MSSHHPSTSRLSKALYEAHTASTVFTTEGIGEEAEQFEEEEVPAPPEEAAQQDAKESKEDKESKGATGAVAAARRRDAVSGGTLPEGRHSLESRCSKRSGSASFKWPS